LDGVAYAEHPEGPWIPMSTMTSIFKDRRRNHPQPHVHTFMNHCPANLTMNEPAYTQVVDHMPPPPHQPMMYKLPTSQSQFYTNNYTKHVSRIFDGREEKPEYFIKPGWIVTNKKRGFIKLAYKAIAVDERGYPLIPDLTSYQEAVYWYVVMKLTFPKFMSGKLTTGSSKYSQKYAQ